MAEYLLRPATAADLPAIKRMVRFARLNPVGIRWPRFVVAVDGDDTIIGCGQVKPHGAAAWELASLVVRRQWRRQGIARAIVATLQQDKTHSLWLTCASRLIPFYERLGFREEQDSRRMPAYFRRVKRFFPVVALLLRSPVRLVVMRYDG